MKGVFFYLVLFISVFAVLLCGFFVRYFTKRFGYLKRLFIHLQSSLRAYEDALSSPCTDGTTTDSSSLPESKARLQKKKKRVSSFSEEPPSDGNNDALKNEARVIFRSLAPEWSPQVGLQYWQGDAVKPIIVIGFAPSLALSSSCHSSSASSAGDAPAASPSALKKKPRGVDLSQWIVRIFPVPPCEDDVPESEGGLPLFKESLLGPHRNCVRRPSFLSWKKGGREGDPKKRKEDEENGHTERDLSENNLELSEEGEEQRDGGDLGVAGAAISTLRPTPYYNGLLLEDMFMRRHSALLHKCCVMFGEPFRTTLQLLKIWALRRSPGVLTLSQSERAVRASAVGSSAEGRARLSSVPATGSLHNTAEGKITDVFLFRCSYAWLFIRWCMAVFKEVFSLLGVECIWGARRTEASLSPLAQPGVREATVRVLVRSTAQLILRKCLGLRVYRHFCSTSNVRPDPSRAGREEYLFSEDELRSASSPK